MVVGSWLLFGGRCLVVVFCCLEFVVSFSCLFNVFWLLLSSVSLHFLLLQRNIPQKQGDPVRF